MKYDVFISYSSKNSTAAIAICHLLEDSGVRCWMAPRDIPLGEKYATVITKAIKGCKAVVLVFSEQSAISPWVESEINIAFSQHKPIFPYKIDSVKLEEHDEFYLMLNSRHWIDSYPDYRTRFHELVDAVCRAIGKPTPVKESATEPATEPESHTNSDRNIRSVKMSQRVIKIAISLIVVVLGIIYLASLFADDEKCPDNEIWYTSIDNQPLSLKDDEFDVKIYSNAYIDGKGIITFDGELTTIGDDAFENCSLTSVTIPDSVTTIGGGAFAACHSLAEFKGKFAADEGRCLIKDNAIIAYAEASGTTYTLPDSVTTIGDDAFRGCDSLISVTIPDSVTTIGASAFCYCDSLTSVTIGDSVTTIGGYAFYNCSSLTGVTIPDSVTTIGDWAFWSCSSLTSVTIPDSVTTIGDYAFYSCYSLTSVTIPDSVTTIEGGVFGGCSNLAEFKGKFAADGGRCLIIDGVLNAFALGCGVTEYTIPDSVTTIGERAFYVCTSLTSVTIPDGVTTIGDEAFADCYSLTSVTIPDSVTTIGDEAFADCRSLAEFKGKFAADGGRCLIKDNTLIAYAYASGTTYTIPDSVTTIGDYAFYNCSSLTSVTIPDSVTTIGIKAFVFCESLTSVTIPDSVTTIGKAAFDGCYSLTSVTIPDSVTTIGDSAFSSCTSLTSVTIPDSVTTIGDKAFMYCFSLTSVYCEATTPPTLGGSSVGSSVFDNNASGRKIYVPAESVEAYKSATNWSEYSAYIVGYDF